MAAASSSLYQYSTLGTHLYDTIESLVASQAIPPSMAPVIMEKFEKVTAEILKDKVTDNITFRGSGNIIYRNCDGYWTFVLPEMTVNTTKSTFKAQNVKIVAYDAKAGTETTKKRGPKKKRK